MLNILKNSKVDTGANRRTRTNAFTLIELLVVIAIIGILSSVVLASLSGARESARDARRQQDINQIRTAIELYINVNGRPPFAGEDRWLETAGNRNWNNGSLSLASELAPYISPLSVDPVNDTDAYLSYAYRAGGSYDSPNDCDFDYPQDTYTLHVSFESGSVPDNFLLQAGNRYCIIE